MSRRYDRVGPLTRSPGTSPGVRERAFTWAAALALLVASLAVVAILADTGHGGGVRVTGPAPSSPGRTVPAHPVRPSPGRHTPHRRRPHRR